MEGEERRGVADTVQTSPNFPYYPTPMTMPILGLSSFPRATISRLAASRRDDLQGLKGRYPPRAPG
jgi:hypothetical protein